MTLNRRYSYSYYYSEPNGCDEWSFRTPSERLYISTDTVEFFFISLITVGWLITLKRVPHTRKLLRWYTFGLCLALYLLYVFPIPVQSESGDLRLGKADNTFKLTPLEEH